MLEIFLRQLLASPRLQEGSAWKRRLFIPGDVLTRAGTVGRSVFLIERGEVAVVSSEDLSASDHRDIEVTKLSAGDIFGESSLFGSYKSIATVRAITDGQALEIDGTKLSICLDDRPEEGYLFYKYFVQVELEKLAKTNRGMVSLALTTLPASDSGDLGP